MPGRALVNAHVRPMTRPDALAEGVCWVDGRIVAVGTESDVRQAADDHGVAVEDARGRTVLPGFVDGHMHLLHVGVRRLRPDLRGARSLQETYDLTRAWLDDHPGSHAAVAEGWDESAWPDTRFPTKQELDEMSPTRPLILRRLDGHVAVANGPALAMAWQRWPEERFVDRDTGLLREDASLYLNEAVPVPAALLDAAVDQACSVAHHLGVTAVGTYEQGPARAALLRAASAGRLRLRVASHIYTPQWTAEVAAGFRTGRPHGPWLLDGGLKVFLDGSLGGRTALLRDPYLDSDDGPWRGTANHTDAELSAWFQRAAAAGVQIHAHAIGDAAIDQGLRAFASLHSDGAGHADDEGVPAGEVDDGVPPAGGFGDDRADPADGGVQADTVEGTGTGHTSADDGRHATADAGPRRQHQPARRGASGEDAGALRHRFEHYELPRDDALAATVRLRLHACAQPNFVGAWSAAGGMYERRIGPAYRLNNRYRTWQDAGLSFSFGSDGMPFGPLHGIDAAVHHPIEEERITVAQAVWRYTQQAAWGLHWDDRIGSLEVGKEADLLVLDTPNLEEGRPTGWTILETVVAGTTVSRGKRPLAHDGTLTT